MGVPDAPLAAPNGAPHDGAALAPDSLPNVASGRGNRVREALAQRLGSLVVVCETVRRRHNVSAILRSCEAFGLHEVHLVTEGSAAASPGTARGAERWVHRRRFETIEASVADLKARGFRVVVADLRPGAWSPEDVPVDRPLAIVLGSEFLGVTARARALADGAVCIPMQGLTGSLNVSASAAILVRTLGVRRRAAVAAAGGRADGADLSQEVQDAFLGEWAQRGKDAERGFLARTAPVQAGEPGAEGSDLSGSGADGG